jgi:hypothetical protein
LNARASGSAEASFRMDLKFIEEHGLVQRYLDGKLPAKGARQLEAWCREHPELLDGLNLAGRTEMSLKLLEAAGSPHDLGEPRPPWWKSAYVVCSLAAVAATLAVALWFVSGRYAHVRGELEDARATVDKGAMVQPTTSSILRVTPDRDAASGRARITVNRAAPLLLDVHIDLGYTGKTDLGYGGTSFRLTPFRLIVDKQGQGRALVLNNLLKDSNGELRMTLNSSALAAGIYTARIEALSSFGGGAVPVGWVTLEVR